MNNNKNDLDIMLQIAIRDMENIEVIATHLKNGANPNTQDEDGNTPLYYAVRRENSPLVKLLDEYKACPLIKNKRGESALDIQLQLAIRNKETIKEIGKLLKNGANPNTQDEVGHTPLYYAVQKDNILLVKLLVKYKACPLIYDKQGETVLDFLYLKNPDLIDLIFQNIKANQEGYGDLPYLFQACLNGNLHLSNRLLDKGIGIFAKDEYGDTCLHIMCKKAEAMPLKLEDLGIVIRLCEKGLDPTQKNEEDDTCITFCKPYSMLWTLLLFYTLKLNQCDQVETLFEITPGNARQAFSSLEGRLEAKMPYTLNLFKSYPPPRELAFNYLLIMKMVERQIEEKIPKAIKNKIFFNSQNFPYKFFAYEKEINEKNVNPLLRNLAITYLCTMKHVEAQVKNKIPSVLKNRIFLNSNKIDLDKQEKGVNEEILKGVFPSL